MNKDGLKIFLAYHKDTPCYKSDIFLPLQVGRELSNKTIDFAIPDNTEKNISSLNPYYCELTGHYWVLKNYMPTAKENYIGFAHYRRLPDFLNISKEDIPSIYGIGYSESSELFNTINNSDIMSSTNKFDIICPCSCYMYKGTVNPLFRDTEPSYNVYEHFKIMHNSNLLDIVTEIIDEDYIDYLPALKKCLKSKKACFYNTFIMKKDLLKKYLEWEFDILEKTGLKIGGWINNKQLRMAGFVGEILFNVWINIHNNLRIGHFPLYMIDFETDYIKEANMYDEQSNYELELNTLNNLYKVTDDKFQVLLNILKCHCKLNNFNKANDITDELEHYLNTADNYFQTAVLLSQYNNTDPMKVSKYFIKSLEYEDSLKLYAKSFLNYAESKHDIELTKLAWDYMNHYELDISEKENYERFIRIYNKFKV